MNTQLQKAYTSPNRSPLPLIRLGSRKHCVVTEDESGCNASETADSVLDENIPNSNRTLRAWRRRQQYGFYR